MRGRHGTSCAEEIRGKNRMTGREFKLVGAEKEGPLSILVSLHLSSSFLFHNFSGHGP